MATTTTTLLTAEEFMEQYADRGLYELVKGEVVELSPGNAAHGLTMAKIASALTVYGEESGLGYAFCGDTAVVTERGPDTVRGPDVSFYREDRFPRAQVTEGVPPVAPNLAVEVFSPSNRGPEMLRKAQEYLDAGVEGVWVVHPKRRQVVIYRGGDPIPTASAPKTSWRTSPSSQGSAALSLNSSPDLLSSVRPREPSYEIEEEVAWRRPRRRS